MIAVTCPSFIEGHASKSYFKQQAKEGKEFVEKIDHADKSKNPSEQRLEALQKEGIKSVERIDKQQQLLEDNADKPETADDNGLKLSSAWIYYNTLGHSLE